MKSRANALKDQNPLVDRYGRQVSYLRISVTDRCDFRCTYCMSENMSFLPKKDLLSFEELELIADAFIKRGVSKIRLTGGEPLVRRDILALLRALGTRVQNGELSELTLTTNGSQLQRFAPEIAAAGVKRINVSLDTLDAALFASITRRGRLEQVLEGISTAQRAGLSIKINMVAMRGVNDHEILRMLEWTHGNGYDLTLIEGMPLGEVGLDRSAAHLPLIEVRDRLKEHLTLTRLATQTGGPARYFRVEETGGQLGFITPMSHNFCESCNRVRLTCTGQLYLCLGQEDKVDLRDALRRQGPNSLNAALDHAMRIKPEGHDFAIGRTSTPPALSRHMSATGG